MGPGTMTDAVPRRESSGRLTPRRWRGLLLVGLAMAALVALVWFLSHRNPGAGAHRRPTATVGVAVASASDIPITIEALGTVSPLRW